MAQRLTGITEEVFDTDLPFHHGGRVFDIRIVGLTNGDEMTGMYRPLISENGTPISHSIERAESVEDAHLEALRWIRESFA